MTSNGHGHPLTDFQRSFLQRYPQLDADDPIVEQAASNARVQEKLEQFAHRFETGFDSWTTALLQQAEATKQQGQLFVQQNSTLQETAKNSAHLAHILTQLAPKISALQRDSAAQERLITTHTQNYKQLQDELSQIRETINQFCLLEFKVDGQIEQLESRDRGWRNFLGLTLVAMLIGMTVLGSLVISQQAAIDQQNRLINSVLIHQQRIERAFGITP